MATLRLHQREEAERRDHRRLGRELLVLGDREADAGTVAVRERSLGDIGVMPLEAFERMALQLIRSRAVSLGRSGAA